MTSVVAARPRAAVRIVRFDTVQRAAHWANALLFGILDGDGTTALLRIDCRCGRAPCSGEDIHLWAGIALPVPLLVTILGPWGAQFRRDLRRINVWTRDELILVEGSGAQGP